MGDIIKDLPSDNLPPTNDEKDMIRWMYNDIKDEEKNKPKIIESNITIGNDYPVQPNIQTQNTQIPQTINPKLEIKSIFIIFIFYILISNKFIDSIFQNIVPIKSEIILLCIKSFVFTIILFIYLNYSYRKT